MSDTPQANPVSETEFRKLMGLFATGVCVIAFENEEAQGGAGISAMTVNSLVSVSLEPRLVCWNLQNSASQYTEYRDADRFTFSILAADQQALARRYAARGDSALSPADFRMSTRGLPVVEGALAWIECRRYATHPAGDHTLILGEVEALKAAMPDDKPQALAFFAGHFGPIGG